MERGRLLALGGSCNDCHTPWVYDESVGTHVPDWTRMLSGHPAGAPAPTGTHGAGDIALVGSTFTSFKLPFGVTYSMNLTPDMESGTGTWTEKMFVDIFRKGRHLGGDGRPVYPPMPWHYVRYLPDEDLRAIFAYLRSIPPVKNHAPVSQVPPPVMEAFRGINDKLIALQADPNAKIVAPENAPPPPPPMKLSPVKKGAGPAGGKTYSAERIAQGKRWVMAGLCNDCHTPWHYDERLAAPGPDWSRMLSGHPEGAPDPAGTLGEKDLWLIGPTFTSHRFKFGVTYSMNLTPDVETGIGTWTEEQFLGVFREAKHPDGRDVYAPMPWTMIRHLPDDDLRAIFAYLQSVPPLQNRVPKPKAGDAERALLHAVNEKLLTRAAEDAARSKASGK